MKNPKVSIVVPIYRVEKYLDRCMTSLLGQTLHDIEIIMVDDGSPDGCPLMCDVYAQKDERIKVIHKHNGGLGLARNSGLEVAEGEFVAFIDSDDYVELDMMEKLYREATEKRLDAIYTEFNTDDYPGIESPAYAECLMAGKERVNELRLDVVGAEPEFSSCSKFQSSACKGLYSMRVIRENGLRFLSEREYISEDMLFNLDFLQYADRVETKSWRFYHYCLNGDSLSHSYRADRWEKLQSMIAVIESRAESFLDKNGLELRLTRTFLAYSKIAISQEMVRDVSVGEKIRAIRSVISTPFLQAKLQKYPIAALPIRWRVYGYIVRYKLSLLAFLLLR